MTCATIQLRGDTLFQTPFNKEKYVLVIFMNFDVPTKLDNTIFPLGIHSLLENLLDFSIRQFYLPTSLGDTL